MTKDVQYNLLLLPVNGLTQTVPQTENMLEWPPLYPTQEERLLEVYPEERGHLTHIPGVNPSKCYGTSWVGMC